MTREDAQRIISVLIMNIPGRHENGLFYPRTPIDRETWKLMYEDWTNLLLAQDLENRKGIN